MALLEKESAALKMGDTIASTTITAPITIVAPVVACTLTTSKTKAGAAPNIGAGSPVSLAAILHKAESKKFGPKRQAPAVTWQPLVV